MKAKIAIIEDNPDNLELMTYLLKQFGYSLVTAMDGEEGLKLVAKEKPDLIICDIQLPKLDGLQIAAQLKADKKLSHIPLIAVTAYSMVGDRDKMLAAGYDHYISKPIDPESFINEIHDFLTIKNPEVIPKEQSKEIDKKLKESANESNQPSILVVDDSSDNLELLTILLKSEGFQTISVDTVEKALLELEKSIPSLIISDLHLPRISGLEFMRRIKKHKVFRNIPAIILSASKPSEKERQDCLALGVLYFIVRPVEAEDFLKLVNKVYQERKGDL